MVGRLHPRFIAIAAALAAPVLGACDGEDGGSSKTTADRTDEARPAGGGREVTDSEEVRIGTQEGVGGPYLPFGEPAVRPMTLEAFEDAIVVDARWQGWGRPTATARGVARVRLCQPSCAAGKTERRPGARVEALRIRTGKCRREPVRFYTRAVIHWPPGLGLPQRQAIRLSPKCVGA